MEQNKEMTAGESLALITETLNRNRRTILRGSARFFILWGCLLTVFSLVIFFLWHWSGHPGWNLLWFTMPLFGYPSAALLAKRGNGIPQNEISRMLGHVWTIFGVFAVCISAVAVFFLPMHVTLLIIVLLGMAECVSGALLKNWPVIIAGFLLGVGGAVLAVLLKTEAQLLLFTLGGILLAATGLIIKLQYK